MKILHHLGHNHKWNLDAYFDNSIGDGFIFNAFSFNYNKIGSKISGYSPKDYMPVSMIDHQFFGNKNTIGGKLSSYPYHPANDESSVSTSISGIDGISQSIKYQLNLGLTNIIVPNFHYESDSFDHGTKILNKINKLIPNATSQNNYFMTICLTDNQIEDSSYVEKMLRAYTDMHIGFDGFYIACSSCLEYKKKISLNIKYYTNLLKILSTLKYQKFKTILAYANWDAAVFLALTDIDAISIGTYENLRNFDISRFTEEPGGGPSKGWYFSDKLLNMIKSQHLDFFKNQNCLDLIANEKNIFSDVILDNAFDWNTTHKPDIHKNYLLSVSRILKQLSNIKDLKLRQKFLLEKIENAQSLYEKLNTTYKIFLPDESSDYFLGTWKAFIQMHST